jgi:hypothetical protein
MHPHGDVYSTKDKCTIHIFYISVFFCKCTCTLVHLQAILTAVSLSQVHIEKDREIESFVVFLLGYFLYIYIFCILH